MFHLEATVYLLRSVAARRLYLLFRVKDAEEALGVDECIVDIVEDALQLGDGGDDVAEQHHVIHDFTDGHARIAFQHQIGREDDNQHGTHLFHETLDAVIIESHLAGLHLVFGDLVLDVELFLSLDLLAVEALNDIYGVDDILDTLTLGLQMVAHFASPAFESFGLTVGDPEINRHDA